MSSTDNTVTVTDAGPARKRIAVTIPRARIAARIEEEFGALASQAALPGFRAGRVPRSLLTKRFGAAVMGESKQKLVSEAVREAIEQHKLRAIGAPELAPEAAAAPMGPEADFAFECHVEVLPDFVLPAWEGMAIERPTLEVTDQHVADEIRRSAYRYGGVERIDGPFQPLDRMVGTVAVTIADAKEPFFQTDRALAVVPAAEDKGRGQFLGVMIDGLGEALEGKSVGASVRMTTTGPEGHEIEAVRGQPLTIDYTITEAERINPATDLELAARAGCATVDLLKEQVRMVLERRRDEEQRSAMREQVFDKLADGVDFPLPERASAAQVERDLARARMELLSRGLEPERVEQSLASLRESSAAQSRRRLKLLFILARLCEELGVEATEAEVFGRIAAIARSRGQRPDALREELDRTGRIGELAMHVREQKAADRVLDKATITEVPADEWNRRVEERVAASRAPAASGAGAAAPADPPKKGKGRTPKA